MSKVLFPIVSDDTYARLMEYCAEHGIVREDAAADAIELFVAVKTGADEIERDEIIDRILEKHIARRQKPTAG